MGQTFRFAAPRAKIALPWGGKLGEMLFDGSARELVRLLAVPVRLQNPPEAAPSTPAQGRNDRRATQIAALDSVKDIRMDARPKRKADGEVIVGPSQRRKQARTKGSRSEALTGTSSVHSSPNPYRCRFLIPEGTGLTAEVEPLRSSGGSRGLHA